MLIDFWATWCGPCIRALPSIQHIAQKFSGQPLVVISISLDTDEGKWKSFVAEHKMTWIQARDAGWNGPIGTRFGVNAIPHTFSIDADGVLQDEHVGDEAIEGKLKKLVAQAGQMHPAGAPDALPKPGGVHQRMNFSNERTWLECIPQGELNRAWATVDASNLAKV